MGVETLIVFMEEGTMLVCYDSGEGSAGYREGYVWFMLQTCQMFVVKGYSSTPESRGKHFSRKLHV